MKKLFWLTLPIVYLLAACGGSKSALQTPTDPNAPLENALLWEISGKGLKKPSYLFGTIHIIGEKDFFWPAKTEASLQKCRRLVMELDMSKQLEMAFQMMALAPMKDGKTLRSLLSEEEYTMVRNYFEKEVPEVGMAGFKLFETYKPFFLSSMLASKMIVGNTKTYELELLALAQGGELETGGLETVADQMSVFDAIPYEEQAKSLVEMVAALAGPDAEQSPSDDFEEMVRLYRTQNIDSLYFSSIGQSDLKGYEDKLLLDRNRRWIPQIIKLSKEKPTFYAVGAGHLGGPEGVVRLLRKEGFTVRPVR